MKTKIHDVTGAHCALLKTNPLRLVVHAVGYTKTLGWTGGELANPRLDASGRLELDFVATPPPGPIVLPALGVIAASAEIADPAMVGATAVRIHAANDDYLDCSPSEASLFAAPAGGAPKATLDRLLGKLLRVVRPGDLVTLDYRPDRANVYVDANNRITRCSFH